MHIQCTKKLLEFLNPEITEMDTDDDFYAWHADFIIIERKKMMILMNDLTRFCVVLYGVKKSDFKNPVDILRQAIFVTMAEQGYELELVEKYVNNINEVTFNRTKNRKLVARLNRAVTDAWWYGGDGFFTDILEQPQVSLKLNDTPVGQDHWKIVHFPNQKMLEYLKLLD